MDQARKKKTSVTRDSLNLKDISSFLSQHSPRSLSHFFSLHFKSMPLPSEVSEMLKQGTGRQQPRIMQYGRLQIAAIEMLYLIFFFLFALRDRYKCKAKTGNAQKNRGVSGACAFMVIYSYSASK